MNETWTPDTSGSTGTLHERLLHALREDIASGGLVPEGKMPPHRELARRLGIGVGTVTRAYAAAERLGLLTSTVGRGTFVSRGAEPAASPGSAGALHDPDALIDISLNVPTLDAAMPQFRDALDHVLRRADIGRQVGLFPHAGSDLHRQTLAEWLRKSSHFRTVDWRRLLVTSGAQHAMYLAVEELCEAGDTILTEAATFNGIRAVASRRRLNCVGVAMDRDGMIPEALEEAGRRHGSRVVYLQPTLQNPTGRTMPMVRRLEVVEVARRHDLTLLEDDVNGPVAHALGRRHTDLEPLATSAPERTVYICSVSKAIGPGLRVGMLVAPDEARFSRFCLAVRANCYTADSLGATVVTQMIMDGLAADVLAAIAHEASTRLVLAQRMLGDAIEEPSFPTSLHAWLPMPELRAERVANGALRRGVVLTPPSSMIVDAKSVSGLRLCLNVVTRPELERALRIVRSVIADEDAPGRMSIV